MKTKKSDKNGILLNTVLTYAVLTVLLFTTVIPLIYTIMSSFKSNSEILTAPERIFPKHITFENYRVAWNSDNFNVKSMLFNSLYYTIACVVFNLFTSSLTGFVFARGRFRLKKMWFAIFSSLLFVNLGMVTIYPYFEVLNFLHISISLNGLLFTKFFGIAVVNIYLVKSYVSTLPVAVEEAARIDGCSFIGTFFRVVAPLLKPILATIGILAFQNSWNDYLMPTLFTMSIPSQRTLIVGLMALKNSSGAASSWNLMLAGSTIALVPVLIAFAIGNKYIVSGLASGAVKG